MNIIKLLYLRDMRRCVNRRSILIWCLMSFLCIFFFINSNGRHDFLENGTVQFMAVMLPQIIFGAWSSMSVNFDLISSDREHNVLDCIITAGITKTHIFLGKLFTTMTLCLIGSIIYLIPINIYVVCIGGNLSYMSIFFEYLFPLWCYVMVYSSWGVLISIIARSTKSSLIWCLACGLALMPRFFELFVDGLGAVFHLNENMKSAVSLIAPAIMMSELTDTTQISKVFKMIFVFLSCITILWIIAYLIFHKQDELNYGE